MTEYPVPDAADFDLLSILRAVSDPIRLDIVTALADGKPHLKKTEGWGAGVTKSTMSHHLRVLREAGLTRTLVDGRDHSCQLRRAELDERFPGLIDALTGGTQAQGDDGPTLRSEVMRAYFADAAKPSGQGTQA